MENAMTEPTTQQVVYNKKVPWIAHSVVTIAILIGGVAIISSMFGNKPDSKKWGAAKPTPSVAVEVSDLVKTNYNVWVDSYGTAEPLTQTELVADISGRVIEVSSKIRAGSSFSKGDVLIQLDDRDYKIELDIAASFTADAKLRYLQELAEADLASKQWNERPNSDAAQMLALRKPQLAAAEAAYKAAQARMDKAKLDLERTQIKAPFDGKVLKQMVDIGQVISPSQAIANIYSTDVIEVRLPIKSNDMENIFIPTSIDTQASVPKVRFSGELGSKTYQWQGEIVRSEGAFDPTTRMLYLVARIKEPFIDNAQHPVIRIGQFLRAEIEGKQLEDVYVIPRRAVSQDFIVSVVDNGLLEKRKIKPLWTDETSVVVSATNSYLNTALNQSNETSLVSYLQPTDRLILTPTANLLNGTRVKALIDTESQPQVAEEQIANVIDDPNASEDKLKAEAASITNTSTTSIR